MFSLFKRANNPLHRAIIENDLSAIEKNISNEHLVLERNELGLTPLELSQLLLRKDALRLLQPKSERKIKILFPDETQIQTLSEEEFTEILNISFTRHLYFPSYQKLKKTIRNLPFTYKKNNILGRQFESEIKSGYSADLKIRWIDNILGYGLFAESSMEAETYVGEYVGEVRKFNKFNPSQNTYCFRYPTKFLSMNSLVIDSLQFGNELRFVNHSDIPNLIPIYMTLNGLIHIGLITKRQITSGEQLTFDYGQDYWSKRQKLVL